MSPSRKVEPIGEELPPPSSSTLLQALIALINSTISDGQGELQHAAGQRGTLEFHVELVMGDAGAPVFADTRLAFTQKRHIKDT